ncbi:hypothetical protein AVW09_10925 [Microbacterium sp. T32]|nr:hypothetical protein AVW09_10925 [Microbacterium sp. T32]
MGVRLPVVESFVDVGADGANVETVVFDVHDEALEERGQEVTSCVACEADVQVSGVLEEVDVGEYSFGA